MRPDPPGGWFGFGVRFFFGALFGFFLAFCFWVQMDATVSSIWVFPLCAIVIGLLAAKWGDDFWHTVKYWLWWVP
jgi:hypothetical protein